MSAPGIPEVSGLRSRLVVWLFHHFFFLRRGMTLGVRGAVFDARFDDVGTVEDYRRTCLALAADADGNVIDPRAAIAADARLRGCIVWPDACVPAGAVLEDVVVTGHVPLPAGVNLRDTTA